MHMCLHTLVCTGSHTLSCTCSPSSTRSRGTGLWLRLKQDPGAFGPLGAQFLLGHPRAVRAVRGSCPGWGAEQGTDVLLVGGAEDVWPGTS